MIYRQDELKIKHEGYATKSSSSSSKTNCLMDINRRKKEKKENK
jgi:hypothetical protein